MFTQKFAQYVCEGDSITCEVDGFDCRATVYFDDNTTSPDERDEGFWPSHDKDAAGYTPPEHFDERQAQAEKVMAAWKNSKWFYCGVAVTVARAGVPLTHKYDHALWGIEYNYPTFGEEARDPNSYLREVANELLPGALEDARATIDKLRALPLADDLKKLREEMGR